MSITTQDTPEEMDQNNSENTTQEDHQNLSKNNRDNNQLDQTYTVPEDEGVIQKESIPETSDEQDNQTLNDPPNPQRDPESMSEQAGMS